MTAAAAPASDAPTALDRARALIEPQLRLLGRLAEIGLDAAEAIGRQARGEEAATASRPADPSLAFARVSRAVRLTVALQVKLVDGLAGMEAGLVPGAPAAKRDADPDYILKARVERIVERTAEAEHDDDAGAVDRLVAETAERLDDIDLYGELLDRPMSEIVARIAADIGLPLDWTRMAREAWARTEMGDGAGEPLAALAETLDQAPPPDPEGSGRRRAFKLAATARRGKRAEKAKARTKSGAEPPEESGPIELYWLDAEGRPYRAENRTPNAPGD